MTKEKIKVEIEASDPTVIIVNGKKFVYAKETTKKIDGIPHGDKIIYRELKPSLKEKIDADKKTIIDEFAKQTNTEELLEQLIKTVPDRMLAKFSKDIREKKPVK